MDHLKYFLITNVHFNTACKNKGNNLFKMFSKPIILSNQGVPARYEQPEIKTMLSFSYFLSQGYNTPEK